MEVESPKIHTWKTLEKNGDNHGPERQIIVNKIRLLNDKFQGTFGAILCFLLNF
jgi:hypothetical protein